MLKKIFITGGCGYIGARLTPYLLKKGYFVKVYDAMIFGRNLNKHKNLSVIKGDIRDIKKLKKESEGYHVFLHLACVSNDPSADLNPKLTKSVNYDCFKSIVSVANKNKFKRFIFASSSSVYGISKKKNQSPSMRRPGQPYAMASHAASYAACAPCSVSCPRGSSQERSAKVGTADNDSGTPTAPAPPGAPPSLPGVEGRRRRRS